MSCAGKLQWTDSRKLLEAAIAIEQLDLCTIHEEVPATNSGRGWGWGGGGWGDGALDAAEQRLQARGRGGWAGLPALCPFARAGACPRPRTREWCPTQSPPPLSAPCTTTTTTTRVSQSRLFKLKLEHVVMEGDGNCQFRSMSWGLYGAGGRAHRGRGRVGGGAVRSCARPAPLPWPCSAALASRSPPAACPRPPRVQRPARLQLARPPQRAVPAGTPRHHGYVRRRAVEYMVQRRDDFQGFLGEEFGDYIA